MVDQSPSISLNSKNYHPARTTWRTVARFWEVSTSTRQTTSRLLFSPYFLPSLGRITHTNCGTRDSFAVIAAAYLFASKPLTGADNRSYRCFKLTWLFPLCCLLFTVGFALREFGAFSYTNLAGFIVSQMFIYFSP